MYRVGLLKKLSLFITAVILLLSVCNVRSYALESWAEDCYVVSEGACLMDADTGTVLFSKDADTAYYPASITKVMTALVVLENCDNLNEMVTFSYDAVHIEEDNSTIIGASEGDELSVLDCLYCLLFQSANEVANALAEHVGAMHPELKSEGMSDRDVFVQMMNLRAQELGCKGTHFNNPSGLTDANHYVTAYDMCLIMAAAINNEEFLDIESHTYWTHAPIARYPDADDPWNTVYPKHSMLKRNNALYYKDAIAGKTGYTMTAGNTLVTAADRNGMRLVVCVLNAHANHYNDTARLLNFGYDNFTSVRISDYDDLERIIQDDFSIGDLALINSYTVGIDSNARVVIPRSGSFTEVRKKLSIERSEPDGSSQAVVSYYYGDKLIGNTIMKLVSIGDDSQIEASAQEDPLLADILGMEPETYTDAQEAMNETGINDETLTSANASSEADGQDVAITMDPGIIAAGMLVLVAIIIYIIRIRKKRASQRRRVIERRRRGSSLYSRYDDPPDYSSKIKKK